MKKCLITLTTLMLIISTSLLLVACSPEKQKVIGNNIGAKMPNITTENKINSGMSALDMYNVGIANYYATDYVGTYQTGDIATKVLMLTTVQGLEIRKVKDNGVYYMDNYSATKKKIAGVEINMMEETVIDTNGIKYRTTNDCAYDKNMVLVAKSWADTSKFASKEELLASRPNDPTRVHMYTINSDTVVAATTPEFDRRNKQYTFTLSVNPTAGTRDYEAVVKDILALNGFGGSNVNFNKLEFEITMWENGLIRSISIDEAYAIKGGISGSVKATAITNYTYDREELAINNLIKF